MMWHYRKQVFFILNRTLLEETWCHFIIYEFTERCENWLSDQLSFATGDDFLLLQVRHTKRHMYICYVCIYIKANIRKSNTPIKITFKLWSLLDVNFQFFTAGLPVPAFKLRPPRGHIQEKQNWLHYEQGTKAKTKFYNRFQNIRQSGPLRAIRSWVGANSGTLTQRDSLMYEARY